MTLEHPKKTLNTAHQETDTSETPQTLPFLRIRELRCWALAHPPLLTEVHPATSSAEDTLATTTQMTDL